MPDYDDDHVVCARGHGIVHDSLGEFRGLLPMEKVIDGYVVRPPRRAVKTLSPLGVGYAVVPA